MLQKRQKMEVISQYNYSRVGTQRNQSPFDRHRSNRQGYTTTSQGSLISASNDWFSLTSAARMAGSRPLDEALTMDALYRKTAYQAKDIQGCNSLEKL